MFVEVVLLSKLDPTLASGSLRWKARASGASTQDLRNGCYDTFDQSKETQRRERQLAAAKHVTEEKQTSQQDQRPLSSRNRKEETELGPGDHGGAWKGAASDVLDTGETIGMSISG